MSNNINLFKAVLQYPTLFDHLLATSDVKIDLSVPQYYIPEHVSSLIYKMIEHITFLTEEVNMLKNRTENAGERCLPLSSN